MQISLDYGDLLTRAWQIAWRNRGLWILGILASCANGGGSGNPGSGTNFQQDFNNFPNREMDQFARFLQENTGTLIAIGIGVVCLVIIINLIVLALGFIGRGGLIGGARLAQANGAVSFAEGWSEGTRNLGRLFGLWLITGLPLLIVGLIIGLGFAAFIISTVATGRSGDEVFAPVFGSFACLVPLICLLVIAAIVLNILNHMGTLAAVSENLAGMSALRRGWEVLRNNALGLVLLAVILWVINLVVGFVSVLPLLFAVVPVVLSGIASAANNDPNFIGGGLAFAALCCVAYLPVLLVINGIFEAWAWSAWALAYARLTGSANPPAPAVSEPPPPAPVSA